MMSWKANLEVNWLMWKWTQTGFLYPTSGCKTPEIVLLNDLHSLCVCDFYESSYKIWNTRNPGVFRAPISLYLWAVLDFCPIYSLPSIEVTFPLVLSIVNAIIKEATSRRPPQTSQSASNEHWIRVLNRIQKRMLKLFEYYWIQIHRKHWKTTNNKNSNIGF